MTTPNLSNSQLQLDPESTGITADYFARDQRWLHSRLAPVFPVKRRRARLMRFDAADALPYLTRTLKASGSNGAEIGTQAATPVEFFVNDGQLTSTVSDYEVEEATENEMPDQPFEIRAIQAAGFLNLEMETVIKPYYTPGSSVFPAGNIVAASQPWNTYNPHTDRVIGPDIKALCNTFGDTYGMRPNFMLIDPDTDTWFMEQLLAERNTNLSISSFRQGGDILPTCDGLIVNDCEIVVPGVRKEGTPLDAVYTPTRVWGSFPYAIFGFSPTLNGQRWNKVGNVYVAQADMVSDGQVPFQVERQRDPVERNKQTLMSWNFARKAQVVVPDMVMAIGPIR